MENIATMLKQFETQQVSIHLDNRLSNSDENYEFVVRLRELIEASEQLATNEQNVPPTNEAEDPDIEILDYFSSQDTQSSSSTIPSSNTRQPSTRLLKRRLNTQITLTCVQLD